MLLEADRWRCRCRNTPASVDKVTSITFKGLLNFTNSQQLAGADSGNCLINSLINNEGQPMQEVLGEVTELFVDNIDQHPYHHHVQPYQIVALGNDSDEMNAWWRVRRSAHFVRLQLWADCANELGHIPSHLLPLLRKRLQGKCHRLCMLNLLSMKCSSPCTEATCLSEHRHASPSLQCPVLYTPMTIMRAKSKEQSGMHAGGGTMWTRCCCPAQG